MKQALLYVCRALGLFLLASRLTAQRPRILCYHGASLEDEHEFRPGLFMQPGTFVARMKLLRKWNLVPVSLDEIYATQGQRAGNRTPVAFTIDDGWAGIAQGMLPELKRQGYPATLYLSTYYVEARRPVFKVAVSYLFWKYKRNFEPSERSCVREFTQQHLLDEQQVLDASQALGSKWEQPLLEELCGFFGEPLDDWFRSEKFFFLSREQVRELAFEGLHIELHTHRHRFSELDINAAEREIEDNKRVIVELTDKAPAHFCFPRGEYRKEQLQILHRQGIRTATTTRNELVSEADSRLEWPRIVDSEAVSSVEFEAEITGFMSLLRQVRQLGARG